MATIHQLAALNRRFYEQHGENFADARPRLVPGVRRILSLIPAGARVLEAGCGDGKAGRWLAANTGLAAYVGLDASAAMLERARRLTAGAGGPPAVRFVQADLLAPDWPAVLGPQVFDWILAFGLFHHLPGRDSRLAVAEQLGQLLAPAGNFVMSNWQFVRSERLRQRVRPWSALGLPETAVEPDDYVLAWERKGTHGLRYVHVLGEGEARHLAQAAGLQIVESFRSDGASGDLTDYTRMRKAGKLVSG